MNKFFAPNLNRIGRLIRAVLGILTVGLGWIAGCQIDGWLGVGLLLLGGFTLFESVRGWCFFRACGIKTKW